MVLIELRYTEFRVISHINTNLNLIEDGLYWWTFVRTLVSPIRNSKILLMYCETHRSNCILTCILPICIFTCILIIQGSY